MNKIKFVLTSVSNFRFLFRHVVSFRRADIPLALWARCCTSDCIDPLLVIKINSDCGLLDCDPV
jgi:hypothetical protein